MQYFNFCNAIRIVDAISIAVFESTIYEFYGRETAPEAEISLVDIIAIELSYLYPTAKCGEIVHRLADKVDALKAMLLMDADAIYTRDPAAKSVDEVIFAYPGFFAIFCHRIANFFYLEGAFLVARFISEYAHSITGADIHPGARIGERFSIDHATGIVIGETSVIGDGVALYHGVTLGAKSLPRIAEERSSIKKRHPTIEDGCTIYAGAGIYGGDTVIGKDSVIGAGVRIASSAPPSSRIFK